MFGAEGLVVVLVVWGWGRCFWWGRGWGLEMVGGGLVFGFLLVDAVKVLGD